ncbi:MAG: GNAT family N-acetyltransferase [Myxococcota bacterium]
MSSTPPMSIALARRLAAAHEALHVDGMRAAAALEGNPYEIEVRRFGRASATIARKVPLVEWYNRVVGLEQQDARALRDMLALYRVHGIRARFEIGPAELTSALAVALAAERVGLERFESTLYAAIDARVAPPASALEVRASPLGELDQYLEIWARGFALPEFLWPDVKRIRAAWFAVPEFHRYVALDGETPVACAGLYVHGDVAYLCMSATLPEARGRGAQSALIARRWRDAGERGCRTVITQTAFGGTSQNNMERAGMRLAHSTGIWLDYGLPV